MFHVILFEPEIPPNTGNVIRLLRQYRARRCTSCDPGFPLDDARVRRAGLDYHEWRGCAGTTASKPASRRSAMCGCSQSRPRARNATMPRLPRGDAFLFGRETAGLPQEKLVG